MNIPKTIRKWVGVLVAAVAYFVVHEGAHAICALTVGAFKNIRILGIGMQVEIFRDKITDLQLGVFSIMGAVATLILGYIMVASLNKILKNNSKFTKAVCYYLTITFLFVDPIYMTVLFRFVGGGDMNGIIYLMPQFLAQAIFGIVLIVNIFIFIKHILPRYKNAFKE